MSYRIVSQNMPSLPDSQPYYINVNFDGVNYALRSGNEQTNHVDTDNMGEIKRVMAEILKEDVENLVLASRSKHVYLSHPDSEIITSNLNLFVFLKSMLEDLLRDTGIDLLGEAIVFKTSRLMESFDQKDEFLKFLGFIPLLFNHKHYEIIIENDTPEKWFDQNTVSLLFDVISMISNMNLQNITSLYIRNIDYSSENIQKLCNVIDKCNLTDFYICAEHSQNGLSKESFTMLINCLQHKKLKGLTFESCKIDDEQVKEIVNILKQKRRNIPRNARYLGRNVPNELLGLIETRYNELETPRIETLQLINNDITSVGMNYLINLVRTSDTLKTLDISENRSIPKTSVHTLLEVIVTRSRENPDKTLSRLVINEIGDEYNQSYDWRLVRDVENINPEFSFETHDYEDEEDEE